MTSSIDAMKLRFTKNYLKWKIREIKNDKLQTKKRSICRILILSIAETKLRLSRILMSSQKYEPTLGAAFTRCSSQLWHFQVYHLFKFIMALKQSWSPQFFHQLDYSAGPTANFTCKSKFHADQSAVVLLREIHCHSEELREATNQMCPLENLLSLPTSNGFSIVEHHTKRIFFKDHSCNTEEIKSIICHPNDNHSDLVKQWFRGGYKALTHIRYRGWKHSVLWIFRSENRQVEFNCFNTHQLAISLHQFARSVSLYVGGTTGGEGEVFSSGESWDQLKNEWKPIHSMNMAPVSHQ